MMYLACSKESDLESYWHAGRCAVYVPGESSTTIESSTGTVKKYLVYVTGRIRS